MYSKLELFFRISYSLFHKMKMDLGTSDITRTAVGFPPRLTVSSRSSWPEVFCRKVVLRNFSKFTGKHMCQRLFFNKVVGLACNFIKKETLVQVFSCEFWEISKNTFFTEHLRWLLLKFSHWYFHKMVIWIDISIFP